MIRADFFLSLTFLLRSVIMLYMRHTTTNGRRLRPLSSGDIFLRLPPVYDKGVIA